ncbi:MAG: hypothetical protein CTR53_04485 [Ferrovibrio sp.]|nr:MAG: hypothetical protein CTR53_04485 [Ferrovibrio sp.]
MDSFGRRELEVNIDIKSGCDEASFRIAVVVPRDSRAPVAVDQQLRSGEVLFAEEVNGIRERPLLIHWMAEFQRGARTVDPAFAAVDINLAFGIVGAGRIDGVTAELVTLVSCRRGSG